MNEWITTYEDRLLDRYLADHPGELFLEVPVGRGGEGRGPRRIDGVLIPGRGRRVQPPESYTAEQLTAALLGQRVHLPEAKRVLNRNVIGQVQVGEALLRREHDVDGIVPVAVCGGGNPDLAWYCREMGLEVAVYEVAGATSHPRLEGRPTDVRREPDSARKSAFMRGWDAAIEGRLYGSVRRRITHTNMGNLFGWIYGEQPDEFREETWARYVAARAWDDLGSQE